MKIKNMKKKGVSTIVTAALLIAITVIIGVALASTVMTVPVAEKPPQLQLDGWASKSENKIKLTHLGGDPVDLDNIMIQTYIPSGTYQGVAYVVPKEEYTQPWPATNLFQAGDTIVIKFDNAFAPSTWGGRMAPSPGEQFKVELYYNGQPISSVTITTLP